MTREGTSAIIANRFNASVKWSVLGAFWGAFKQKRRFVVHFSIVDYMFSMRISLVLAWILLVLYYSSIMIIIIISLVFSSASVVVIIIKRVVG